jgi:hypothetical protein
VCGFYNTGRNFALGGAGIEGIEARVDITIEAHSGTAREHHTSHHGQEAIELKGGLCLRKTKREAEEGEREGEDGVGKFHQFEVMANGFEHEGKLRRTKIDILLGR